MNLTTKEVAIEKIKKYETQLLGCKYVFIDNKSKITNIIFTGSGQKYYMMISWFNDNLDYNYLYLNPINCNYTNIDIYKQIILNCNSNHYNMIGISYGGYAAMVYSSMFPTQSLIIYNYFYKVIKNDEYIVISFLHLVYFQNGLHLMNNELYKR